MVESFQWLRRNLFAYKNHGLTYDKGIYNNMNILCFSLNQMRESSSINSTTPQIFHKRNFYELLQQFRYQMHQASSIIEKTAPQQTRIPGIKLPNFLWFPIWNKPGNVQTGLAVILGPSRRQHVLTDIVCCRWNLRLAMGDHTMIYTELMYDQTLWGLKGSNTLLKTNIASKECPVWLCPRLRHCPGHTKDTTVCGMTQIFSGGLGVMMCDGMVSFHPHLSCHFHVLFMSSPSHQHHIEATEHFSCPLLLFICRTFVECSWRQHGVVTQLCYLVLRKFASDACSIGAIYEQMEVMQNIWSKERRVQLRSRPTVAFTNTVTLRMHVNFDVSLPKIPTKRHVMNSRSVIRYLRNKVSSTSSMGETVLSGQRNESVHDFLLKLIYKSWIVHTCDIFPEGK